MSIGLCIPSPFCPVSVLVIRRTKDTVARIRGLCLTSWILWWQIWFALWLGIGSNAPNISQVTRQCPRRDTQGKSGSPHHLFYESKGEGTRKHRNVSLVLPLLFCIQSKNRKYK